MNIYTSTIAYLYKWTNTETNRWYIGSRTKRGCHPNDGYICSSRTVKPLILEHKEQWTRTILCLGTPEYILALETRLLTAVDAKNDPLSYNQHNGDGKFTTTGVEPWNKDKSIPRNKPAWNRGLTKENNPSVAKISASRQGQPAHNKGKPARNKGMPNPGVSRARKSLPKDVCRIFDGKEMSMIYYNQWIDKVENPEKWKKIDAEKSRKQSGRKQSADWIAKRAQARKDYYAKKKAP